MRKFVLFFGIAGSLIFLLSSCGNSPIKVFPANPHYFFYKDKPVVLITSDHHYGAIVDKDFDYTRFLDYLGSNGMNLTRIYPGGMFEAPDKYQAGNPLGPRPGRQLLPWARSRETGANQLLAEPGQPSYKFDLDKWNPDYFARLKAFIKYANRRNIIVEIPFFNGMYADSWPLMAMYHTNNIQGVGQYEPIDCGIYTSGDKRNEQVMKYQKEYIKKITTELNEFDNLIFDICDEPSLQGLPGGNIIVHADSIIVPWLISMKEAFLQAEESLPKKHLLGQTVQNLSPDLSKESWCNWLPCEYAKTGQRALDMDYKANKPVVNVESNYFGMSLTKNPYGPEAVRLEGWMFMLGGGAGCINLNGEYHRGQESGGSITQTQIIPQKKILKNFMNSLDLSGVSRCFDFTGIPSDAMANALAEKGKQYALYIFHGKFEGEWGSHYMPESGKFIDTLVVNTVPLGVYQVEWLDPATGIIKSTENLKWEGGSLKLITPPYNLDIALRMRKQK
jgi:Protein of unknown function (DUF4038)